MIAHNHILLSRALFCFTVIVPTYFRWFSRSPHGLRPLLALEPRWTITIEFDFLVD